MARLINLIVVHCSATPSGRRISLDGRTAPAVIDAWHRVRGFLRRGPARDAFNWRLAHIGYHYVVDLDGYAWTGRAHDEVGAHTSQHNAHSIGICMVGGSEPMARYTHEQWVALENLLLSLGQTFKLPLDKQHVKGHRDCSPDKNRDGQVTPGEWLKTCPGFDVAAFLANGLKPLPQHVFEAPAKGGSHGPQAKG